MKPRKLAKEEADKLRQKSFTIDKYVMMRALNRLRFRKMDDVVKIDDVVKYGDIWQEGKNKFRAVLPIKKQKIAYVIFEEYAEFLEFKTCGIAVRKDVWG